MAGQRGKLIVVGGHSRNVGKTTVMSAILERLRGEEWIAVKISKHRHGSGLACVEETGGRFLDAGARRAFLLRAPDERFSEAVRHVEELLGQGRNVIAESNRLAAWLRPDLTVFVIAPRITDWKPSSDACLRAADLVVVSPLQ